MSIAGEEIYRLTERLFPIYRHLMGEGVRETLRIIKGLLPELNIYEIPTGTKVFDWTIPEEWEVKEAYLEDENGQRYIDFKDNNLYVVAYSGPVDIWGSLSDLKKYFFVNETQPDAVPYVTAYYKETVGLCIAKNQLERLGKGKYHLVIKSEKRIGSLSYADLIIEGETQEEILFHSVICHPSLANDELSGVCLAVYLAKWIMQIPRRRYTYRFVFVPETIGAIAYINQNFEVMKRGCRAGYILSCEGDNLNYSFLPTINGNTLADRAARNILKSVCPDFKEYSFLDRGSDERQYNSPGVDIPVCLVCRTKAEEFEEYHTSRDNMDFVSAEGFEGSFQLFIQIIQLLEMNHYYQSVVLCEPRLGIRGLYSELSFKGSKNSFKKYIDFIAYADGTRDLIEISDITGIPFRELKAVIEVLLEKKLIMQR